MLYVYVCHLHTQMYVYKIIPWNNIGLEENTQVCISWPFLGFEEKIRFTNL